MSLRHRLARQLAANGVKGSQAMADALLTRRGQMQDGKLTPTGEKRQAMGAEGRAKDRASKYSGRPASDFKYNPKTNGTRVKR